MQAKALKVLNKLEITFLPEIDSLVNHSKTLSGMDLLKFYQSFHYSLYELNDAEIHFFLIEDLMDRVRTDKDELGEALAYLLKVDAMHNYSVPDSIFRPEATKALDFMKNIKDNPKVDVYYFNIGLRLVDNYILS